MRWEYFVHTLNAEAAFSKGQVTPREMQEVLNRYGGEGWELVSVFTTKSGRDGSRLVVLTFKRPLEMAAVPAARAR
jgi:hypothetical protein